MSVPATNLEEEAKPASKHASTVDEALQKPENASEAEEKKLSDDPVQEEMLKLFNEDAEEGLDEPTPTDESKTKVKDEPLSEPSEEETPADTTEEVIAAQESAVDAAQDGEVEPDPEDYLEEEPELVQQKSEEELAKERSEWLVEAQAGLEKHYDAALTQEDRDLLITEPDKVLPKLLANASLNMYNLVMGALTQNMPSQISEYMDQQSVAQSSEDAFYKRWPQLAELDESQNDVLTRTVAAYRQMNPSVTVDRAIDESGAMAMVALRIPLKVDGEQEQENIPDAFKPAAPGGGASTPKTVPTVKNEFELLADELLEDEEL